MNADGVSSAPQVSVIIATYNRANVLPYAIGSVLDQTFADFEVLVVGDGCTDDSESVVSSVGDPRVRWINLPQNTGHQYGPNNEGQRLARGEIVAYLGHDDLWLPHHLEFLVAAMGRGASFAHTSTLWVNPGRAPYLTPADGWTYAIGNAIPPTSVAVARARLREIGGWRAPRETGHLYSDSDVWARLAAVAGPPAWVKQLTCVKFSAEARRDVYRTLPTFEEEHWLRVIREAPDPEAAMLATVGLPYDLAGEADEFALPLLTRAWRSVRYRARKRLGLPAAQPASVRHQEFRRFKGL